MPRWSKDRLLVLVGERHLTAVRVKPDWRGRWCAQRMATVPLDGELSLAVLSASLHRAVDGWSLDRAVGIHWFLPPDVLAVALVAKRAENGLGQLVLPYAQGQTASMLMSSQPGASTWVWIHQAWVDLLQQAGASIHGHMLYVHPRAAFWANVLGQPGPFPGAGAALRALPDGRYVHLFAGQACVRSYTRPDDTVPGSALSGERDRSELDAASTVLGLPLSSDQTTGLDDGPDELRLASLLPVSAAVLHRTGILCHALAEVAERRVRALAVGLSLAVLAGAGVMYWHQQDTNQLNADMHKELRELVPQANNAGELKAVLSRQNRFLSVADKLHVAPNLFQALGRVIEKTPPDTTLTQVDISATTLSVSAHVQNAKKARADIDMGDSPFKVLTAQPERDEPAQTGGVHRTYTSSTPGGQP